ncbi:hypothetical protein [[Mycobacterium] crassicus]|uniref:Uncharacterized protein n=1 Tax=[Mycobacterium] crassicus TaxID=2872309 RepID=A0ABU5XE04_9MYCO|nr:hypothetical protein [Mycolicibacter sp. MYC098]MEB3020494.1 hypothetical protein [Mycolicibacter sp. MYC098]
MTSRDVEASDADLAGQAMPVAGGESDLEDDVETPGAGISLDEHGDHADLADVVEQHQGVPSIEDDYDR